MVAISIKLAGYVTRWLARVIVIVLSSKGCLRASKTLRGNSGISSRNKTPLCAKEISPGMELAPPPMIETLLAVWCGERKGLVKITSSGMPQREWSLVIEICSLGEGGGSRFAATFANKVLPAPGGPEKRILCRPAIAIVIARLARSWPWISSKVGESVFVFLTVCMSIDGELIIVLMPLRWSTSSVRLVTPMMEIFGTNWACERLALGT